MEASKRTITLVYAELKEISIEARQGEGFKDLRPEVALRTYEAQFSPDQVQVLRPIPVELRGQSLDLRRSPHIDPVTGYQTYVPANAAYVIATRNGFGFVPEGELISREIQKHFSSEVTRNELEAICNARAPMLSEIEQLRESRRMPISSFVDKGPTNRFARPVVLRFFAIAAGVVLGLLHGPESLLDLGQVAFDVGGNEPAVAPGLLESRGFDVTRYITGANEYTADPYRNDVAFLLRFIAAATNHQKIEEVNFTRQPEQYLGQNGTLNLPQINVEASDPDTLAVLKGISEYVRTNWERLPRSEQKLDDITLGRLLIPAFHDALNDEDTDQGSVKNLLVGLITEQGSFRNTGTGHALTKIYWQLTRSEAAAPLTAPAEQSPARGRHLRHRASKEKQLGQA